MHARRLALVTEEEFLQLPESMQKVELIDGEVVMSPAPSFLHQEILRRLLLALGIWARGRRVTVGQSPLDIRFGPDRILQPDAFVLLDPVPLGHKGPLDRVPELCIEVISSDRLYDRVTKRMVYAAAGVREYWVLEHLPSIERFFGEGLSQIERIEDTLASPLLPGFSLPLEELYAGL